MVVCLLLIVTMWLLLLIETYMGCCYVRAGCGSGGEGCDGSSGSGVPEWLVLVWSRGICLLLGWSDLSG